MPVLIGVIDESNVLAGERLEESRVLLRSYHPAPVDGEDRLGLFRGPPHDPIRLFTPHQGVMIDHHIREPEPINGGDFGPERPVGT